MGPGPGRALLASVMTVVMVALVVAFAADAVWFGVQAYRLGRRVGLVRKSRFAAAPPREVGSRLVPQLAERVLVGE
jgi:hypothetical protein